MAEADKAAERIAKIYETSAEKGAEGTYDAWAGDYDADTAALGFRLPGLAAAYLARHLPAGEGPILDAGAGTGQVGGFLQGLGYDAVHGIDMSQGMLDVASRTGAYVETKRQVLGEPLDYADDFFVASLLIGSLGPGHAPPECLREIVRITRPGGVVVFNVVAGAWEEQGIPALLSAMEDEGLWVPLERSPEWDVYQSPVESVPCFVFVYRVI